MAACDGTVDVLAHDGIAFTRCELMAIVQLAFDGLFYLTVGGITGVDEGVDCEHSLSF